MWPISVCFLTYIICDLTHINLQWIQTISDASTNPLAFAQFIAHIFYNNPIQPDNCLLTKFQIKISHFPLFAASVCELNWNQAFGLISFISIFNACLTFVFEPHLSIVSCWIFLPAFSRLWVFRIWGELSYKSFFILYHFILIHTGVNIFGKLSSYEAAISIKNIQLLNIWFRINNHFREQHEYFFNTQTSERDGDP